MDNTKLSITCRGGQFSRHTSWHHPSPACRDRRPLPGTSCVAYRHWCLQRLNPFSPDSVHKFPAVHWEVL